MSLRCAPVARFVYGDKEVRDHLLKLIPHINSGSWMIKQSVGTTPVILGKALKTSYHSTNRYIEVRGKQGEEGTGSRTAVGAGAAATCAQTGSHVLVCHLNRWTLTSPPTTWPTT
jgi:hypothetical protein